FPGLAQPHSQFAVPVLAPQRTVGVIYAESPEDLRFDHTDEDALAVLASQLGGAIAAVGAAADDTEERTERAAAIPRPRGTPVVVRHYCENDSIFLGDDYIIKGIAGAILWTLLCDYVNAGRTEFTNRALRLDPRLRLP